MNDTTSHTTKTDKLLVAIAAKPWISAVELREKFAAEMGNADRVSTVLTNLMHRGLVQRRKIKKNGRIAFCYHASLFDAAATIEGKKTGEAARANLGTAAIQPDGFKVAILVCRLQAALATDPAVVKACLDCADAIRAKMPEGGAA